jgi:hypothetical protein
VGPRAENLTPTGIRSPDHPARNQSLSRQSYPAHSPNDTPKFLLQLFHTYSPKRLTCLTILRVICGFVLKLSGKETHFTIAHFKQESVPYF